MLYHGCTPSFGSQEKLQKWHLPDPPISLWILLVSLMLQSLSKGFHHGGPSGQKSGVEGVEGASSPSSSSSLLSLLGERVRVSRLDLSTFLRPSGVEGAAGAAAGEGGGEAGGAPA